MFLRPFLASAGLLLYNYIVTDHSVSSYVHFKDCELHESSFFKVSSVAAENKVWWKGQFLRVAEGLCEKGAAL
jgi:hypothetical protein